MSEDPLVHPDDVARIDFGALVRGSLLLLGATVPADIYVLVIGPVSVAAGKRHRIQGVHTVDIGVLAGALHFSDDIEWPVILDLHTDPRILEISFGHEFSTDRSLKVMHSHPVGWDRFQQRQLHLSCTIHLILAPQ